MAKKKVSHKATKLTAHGLLGSLSYWGSAARLLLASIIIGFAFFLNVTGNPTGTWRYFDSEIMFLLYGIATVLLLDIGYVVAARALPLSEKVDRWVVMMSDLLISAIFVAPSLVITTINANSLRVTSFIIALFVISVRILVGLLFAKRK